MAMPVNLIRTWEREVSGFSHVPSIQPEPPSTHLAREKLVGPSQEVPVLTGEDVVAWPIDLVMCLSCASSLYRKVRFYVLLVVATPDIASPPSCKSSVVDGLFA